MNSWPSRRDWLATTALLAASLPAAAQAPSQGTGPLKYPPLTPESTLGQLVRHPAFSGFARRILPWDDRGFDEDTKLSRISALLPYHSNIHVPATVAALNRLIDDAAQGHQVFYELYSDAERQADPGKSHTGLFFLRGRPGAPFAIIAPGGGFAYVGSVHEGFPYAVEINRAGFNTFVLKYRAGQGGHVATQDLAAAISLVFRNAKAQGIGTEGYSLWGSSAGARMAASIGSHGVARFNGEVSIPKPSTVVLAYTAHADLAADEPPTFVVVGERDGISPPAAMERRVAALRRAGTEVEYHQYAGVGHGFGLGIGTSAEGWIADAIRFWQRHQSR